MNIRRIATVSLSYEDFPSFDAKLDEACRLTALAASRGAALVVLPEVLNQWRGDGPNHPNPLSIDEMVLENWQTACAKLIECAARHAVTITVPVYVREADHVLNVFYLVDGSGAVLGRYEKEYPTVGELKHGVIPGTNPRLLAWDGLRIGGAICYDINFPALFARQRQSGADLFLCPSLFPGGLLLNHYAFTHEVPIVLAYPAWSRIIGPLGEELVQGGLRHETLRWGGGNPVYVADVNFDYAVVSSECSYELIREIEKKYAGRIAIRLHQHNCVFYFESLCDEISISQVLAEHGQNTRRDSLRDAGRQIDEARQQVNTETHARST
jgi:predicted amidohydrolase